MPFERLSAAPTDFDFALGTWHVRHRRLKERLAGCTEWVAFSGHMATAAVLGGYGNVEDNLLDLPDGSYRAVALRSFDPHSGQWSIWWLDGRFPGRLDVPVIGHFDHGVGTFYADDVFNGRSIRVRFLWLTTTPGQPRWEQAFSPDNGATWETNWTMDFFR